jgi:hypothetical protein
LRKEKNPLLLCNRLRGPGCCRLPLAASGCSNNLKHSRITNNAPLYTGKEEPIVLIADGSTNLRIFRFPGTGRGQQGIIQIRFCLTNNTEDIYTLFKERRDVIAGLLID